MSTRNIHVNTASYTILVAGREKNTGEEWDVLEFSSLTELKKYRKSHPEKMAFSYSYALSRGVDTQFRHINIAEADHFKQFLRQIERKRLVRTVLIFTESSDQLSRATDRVPGLPASPGYVQ